jgi:stage II sporulation protein M
MFNLRANLDYLARMKPYLVMSTMLFFAGVIVGGTNPSLQDFLYGQLAALAELGDLAESAENPGLAFFLIIFFNNTIKSALVIYMGALFGIFPAIFLVVNGMILGYLYKLIGEQGENAALIFLKGVLPHGIIEIPAVLLACAFGLKFGALVFRSIGAMFRRQPGLANEYEAFVIRSVPALIAVVAALMVAAVVETTLSVWLLAL